MLKYIQMTNKNLEFATNIQMKIFPNESAYEHYKFAIKNNLDYEKYYLVYDNDDIVGITGLYSNEDFNEINSIWLGWFGVLNEFRRKGYGQQILIDTINMAKDLAKKYPIKYFRLYTSEKDDSIAQPLYYKIMDIKEYYNNVNDVNYDNTCVIFSKSLFETPITYWNDKFLNLKEIIAVQELGNNEMLNK